MNRATAISGILLTGILMLSITGCSGSRFNNAMVKQSGSFNVENVEMLQRPIEYTIKDGNAVKSQASASWLFGIFPLTGNAVTLKAPVMGIGSSVAKSEAEAIKMILDSNPDADGVMITQSFVEKSGFPGIYTVENAYVKGRTFSIVNLGNLTREESSVLRKLRSESNAKIVETKSSLWEWIGI